MTRSQNSAQEFDYVIVGAGSSGCALAARLSEQSGVTVCVLEAGLECWPKISAIPAAVVHTVGNPKYDWRYTSQPDPTRNDVVESWPRGLGPGGSSLINGMIFVRGARSDFDAWEELGSAGWSYKDVLPFFRRMESSQFEHDQARGRHGPQSVERLRWQQPITEDFVRAAVESGIEYTPDYNSTEQDGVGYTQAFQRGGQRHSAFDAFLKPVLSRKNIELRTGCQVLRLIMQGRSVTGVGYARPGAPEEQVRARRLVVLSGGTINSPHLMMLSGIGPAAQLKAAGVAVVADLPGVGQNLMEHATAWIQAEVNRPTLNQEATPIRKIVNLAKWLARTGAATTAVAQAVAFIRTSLDSPSPDIQIHFCGMGTSLGPKGLVMPNIPLISVGATVSHPRSRGELRLHSADPRQPPLIFPRLLEAPEDVATLGEGVRAVERILEAPAMKQRIVRFLNLPPDPSKPEEFERYLRSNTGPAYHPVGTCRMGTDRDAVVDPGLMVHGISGLAIADASIMPRHISGNTYAAAVMIGERAADLFNAGK